MLTKIMHVNRTFTEKMRLRNVYCSIIWISETKPTEINSVYLINNSNRRNLLKISF